jgi:hypothetical protein
MYGSNFIRVTFNPLVSSILAIEAEAMPLPRLEITPPVIKINLVIFIKKAFSADNLAAKRRCFKVCNSELNYVSYCSISPAKSQTLLRGVLDAALPDTGAPTSGTPAPQGAYSSLSGSPAAAGLARPVFFPFSPASGAGGMLNSSH